MIFTGVITKCYQTVAFWSYELSFFELECGDHALDEGDELAL